jgi:hypothetical protein
VSASKRVTDYFEDERRSVARSMSLAVSPTPPTAPLALHLKLLE